MSTLQAVTHVENIRYDKAAEALYIIDQTLLPNEEKEIPAARRRRRCTTPSEPCRSGAPRPSASARPTACMSWPDPSPEDGPGAFLERLEAYGRVSEQLPVPRR